MHQVILNGELVATTHVFHQRLSHFLNLIKPALDAFYRIETRLNLPVAAGLASSACGFAALIKAFSDLYAWDLPEPILSILCRMGSGSACRSLWQGFVEWHRGERDDGLDSFAEPLPYSFPDLAIGLHILTRAEKPIASRDAMNITTKTSLLYEAWPKQVEQDLSQLKHALIEQDFERLGTVAEHNALSMHATMLSAYPPICYLLPETLAAMQTIWQLRKAGLPIYFTEDAGPNLKILTLQPYIQHINAHFPNLEWVLPPVFPPKMA
jgi:diphosphomevalonate decarboxylase